MYRPWFPLLALYTLVAISVIILLAPRILAYNERDPLTYREQPFKVTNSPIAQGEEVKIRITRCNWSGGPLSYTVQRTLVGIESGEQRILPPRQNVMIAGGCETTTNVSDAIPDTLPPGHYVIQGVALAAGKWKTVTVPFSTEPFEVVAGKEHQEE